MGAPASTVSSRAWVWNCQNLIVAGVAGCGAVWRGGELVGMVGRQVGGDDGMMALATTQAVARPFAPVELPDSRLTKHQLTRPTNTDSKLIDQLTRTRITKTFN